jgi:hypothetical protein
MLQWLGTDPSRLVLYNARERDRFVSVVEDVHAGKKRTLPRPVGAVSLDGKKALSFNFSRAADLRPGYGYVGIRDPWFDDLAPGDDGIYLMDLDTGESRLVVSLARVARFRPRPEMPGQKHYFNHMQFAPDGSRFLFLHRWGPKETGRPWGTRLFTSNPDGSDLHYFDLGNKISHFDWCGSDRILAWAVALDGTTRYFLFTDRTQQREIVGDGVLTCDGHCSYSPHGRWILTDTYPDNENVRTLLLYDPASRRRIDIGRFFSPPELAGEMRCDLHPRWSRDGAQVCIDSAHERERQIYVLDVSDLVNG